MPGDPGLLPAPISAAAPGTGPAALAAELLGRVRAELPVIGELGRREQVLVSAWLIGLRSARTRRASAGDVAAWLGWLAGRDTGALAARRVHVDLWAARPGALMGDSQPGGTTATARPIRGLSTC